MMQDRLQAYVASLGYTFDVDFKKQAGVWHYISRDNFKGAYIFTEVKFSDGYSVRFTIYDYKKAEAFTERFDSRELSEDEVKKVEKARLVQEEQLQKEKDKQHEECRVYCLKEFEKHDFTQSHEYFTLKGFPEVPGGYFKSRKSEVSSEAELLCPLQDAAGVMWGYQIISASGQKRFNIGQRTESCFVPLGDMHSPKRIYIAEGVATGLSVFLGVGGAYPTVSVLSAANITKVARALRKKYPKTPFIICADNDQWLANGNVGAKFAELACQETDGCISIHPDFPPDHPEKPTDWNDVHRLRGLNFVTEILQALKPLRPEHFWALGFDAGNYFFTTLRAPIVHNLREFSPTEMLKLLSLRKWTQLYPECVNPKGKIDWEPIKSDLINKAQLKGHFVSDKCLGLGIYMEKEKPLVHLGDRVWHENVETELQDFESDILYDLKPRRVMPERGVKPVEFIPDLVEVLRGYTWENKMAPELLIGWLYCAYASGAIPWRPHVMVSAEKGTGKTTLLEFVVKPLLKYSGFIAKVGATEAAIRQDLKNNAVPMLHDEFDRNNGDERKLASVLNLIRAASSGGEVSRGTQGGKALHFTARFAAYLTGINCPVLNEADQSRIAQLRLLKQNPMKWAELEKRLGGLCSDLAARGLFWQVVDSLPAHMQSVKIMQDALSVHSERFGQQYGALLAGYWHSTGLEVLPVATAKLWASNLEAAILAGGDHLEEEKSFMQCFDWLMQMPLRVNGEGDIALGHLLQEVSAFSGEIENWPHHRDLATVGIKVVGEGEIFVLSKSRAITAYFAETAWANYSEHLRKVPGVIKERMRVTGQNPQFGYRIKLQK